jgi:hypothetical protein
VLDKALPIDRYIGFGSVSFDWLPDGSGCLVNGLLLDLASQRLVFGVQRNHVARLLDQNRILARLPHHKDEVVVLEIPWTGIHESLTQLEDADRAALFRPGQPVSLEIESGNLRGEQEATEALIREQLEEWLSQHQTPIQPGAMYCFRARFSERAGERLPIYTRRLTGPFSDNRTDRTACEAHGQLVVELMMRGNDDPLWSDALTAKSSRKFDTDDITDDTLRENMLSNLGPAIWNMNPPYFIPESNDGLPGLPLPLVLR